VIKTLNKAVIPNVICTFCACCCDDIEVTVKDGTIVEVKNGCAISISKFLNYNRERYLTPMIRKNGKLTEAKFIEAVEEAASILLDAKYPVLYGWSSTSCEAIEVGVKLAEIVGGVIDNTTTTCHGPSILGIQDVGESTCTLGEVRHRADLIIYWGCNPVHAHPRHMLRYTAFSKGRFRKGRGERKLIVVDVRKTDTAKLADQFIQVKQNEDYELLSALRVAVNGEEIEQDEVAGVPVERIEEIAELMINCNFGVLFFGLGITMTAGKSRNIDAALSLVRDLNAKTKFLIMPMRGHFNVTGANEATAWQTGYPFAVDFSHGYPRYNPGDTSVIDILSREECDSALIVASDPVSNFPASVSKHLTKIPLITVDPHMTATTHVSEVVFPSALVGVEAEGTIYRMDGVPLLSRKVVEPPNGVKSDVEILQAIFEKVRELKGDG
jgi:formylmethanofuran dehydrogenase subunit B